MSDIKSVELALQHAQRALVLADQDQLQYRAQQKRLEEKIAELQKLIDEWFRPRVAYLEHTNLDLTRRCKDAETQLATLAGRSG
ncbi:hypothetical protein [Methylobacterium sp. 17Sr1-1]|uniref:hypothetical protein n=1 Tax=Methylobacterium sp. 17Sr1-1 TaxID=2202826 RepID=UPI0013A5B33B|nr:hypothetical protein [Methylobacterium sp. 17Sr1-1]